MITHDIFFNTDLRVDKFFILAWPCNIPKKCTSGKLPNKYDKPKWSSKEKVILMSDNWKLQFSWLLVSCIIMLLMNTVAYFFPFSSFSMYCDEAFLMCWLEQILTKAFTPLMESVVFTTYPSWMKWTISKWSVQSTYIKWLGYCYRYKKHKSHIFFHSGTQSQFAINRKVDLLPTELFWKVHKGAIEITMLANLGNMISIIEAPDESQTINVTFHARCL